jgi:hypothetical protein
MIRFLILLLPFTLFSLEKQPWLGDIYEFHYLGGYAYSRFHKVQGAVDQLTSPYNVNLLFSGLDFSFSPDWSVDADVEFADTSFRSFQFRSFGIQGRYLWLDDIIGDWASLVTSFSARIVSPNMLKDVSTPYHGNVDLELSISLGKELDSFRFWRFRFWGFGLIGIANRGSPWLRGGAFFEGNLDDTHKWALYLLGSHGYGRKRSIDIANFRGYGRIRQKSIDIGARYGYRMGVWGTLRFDYLRRVKASLCPENVNTFVISYLLPFSF